MVVVEVEMSIKKLKRKKEANTVIQLIVVEMVKM